MGHRGFHGLRRLQHLCNNHLVGGKQSPNLVHARHQGTVDDLERTTMLQRVVQIASEPVFRSFLDVQRQALVEWHIFPFLDGRLWRLGSKVCTKRRDRIVTAPPDEILGELSLVVRNRWIALELLGVHDGHVKASLDTVIQKHRVEHLRPAVGRPKETLETPRIVLVSGSACLSKRTPSMVSTPEPM